MTIVFERICIVSTFVGDQADVVSVVLQTVRTIATYKNDFTPVFTIVAEDVITTQAREEKCNDWFA